MEIAQSKVQLFAKVARSTVQKQLFSAHSSMQFYAKSGKLLHIQHPLEVRFVLRINALLFMVIHGFYS